MRTLGAFIDWVMRNIVRLAILVVIAFAAIGVFAQTCDKPGELPGSIGKTQYQVITDSRTYYTDSYEWEGTTLVLHGFWVKEGSKWVQYKTDLPMSSNAYGRMEVRKR